MEKTKTIFCSADVGETEMQCYANADNQIFIDISSGESPYEFQYICLDRPTAIKLVKHLKNEISKLEVLNERI
jgi:hypothetical protein